MTKETYYMHLDFNHGGHRRPRRQQLRFFRQHDRVLRESRHKIIPRTILRGQCPSIFTTETHQILTFQKKNLCLGELAGVAPQLLRIRACLLPLPPGFGRGHQAGDGGAQI
jgi:hypothetical protein